MSGIIMCKRSTNIACLRQISQCNPYHQKHGLSTIAIFNNKQIRPLQNNIKVLKPHAFNSFPLTSQQLRISSEGARRKELPREAEVVVCGGGVVGASVALHLKMQGWRNVELLEQGKLTCGTTWHSVGLLGRLKGDSAGSAMACYSRDLYKQLDSEGYHTGWKRCGSLYLARKMDRLIQYKRTLQMAELEGVEESRVVTPNEIQELVPLLKTEDLQGGIYVPGDGAVSAPDAAMAMANKARDLGVGIHEEVKVKRVVAEDGKVRAVETDQGDIQCQVFVNAAGMWARELGHRCTTPVRVPLHACEHFYIVTKPVQGVDRMMPEAEVFRFSLNPSFCAVVRDYDGRVYVREWSGGFLLGGFEPVAKPIFTDGVPEKFEFQLLPEDWDHFQVLMDEMLHRVPMLESAEIKQFINGPESFTPDGKFIIGEAPEVENYFIATGMNSWGITAAGGVGKYLAEWITDGFPSRDLWAFDIRRFGDLHNDKEFLRERVKETLGMHDRTKPPIPQTSFSSGRCKTLAPLHDSLHNSGAAFEQQSNLYERVAWFEGSPYDDKDLDKESCSEKAVTKTSFGKPAWFDSVRSEYWACRSSVCLMDMSYLTTVEIKSAGQEAEWFLQHVCSTNVVPDDNKLGTVVNTGMQNKRGGYENDCSIVRLDNNKFFMIAPSGQHTKSLAWMNRHLPKGGSVQINDVTSMYTAINLIGPKAAEVLGKLTDSKLDEENFPRMTSQEIKIAEASGIKAMRLTCTGEDGWILYIPSEYALQVYDSLMHAGKMHDIRNAGYYALKALRTEQCLPDWGTDLTAHTTPLEGSQHTVLKWEKGDFIGYETLLKQKNEGIKKKLVQFVLDGHNSEEDIWPWGGEPIYRNGLFCGTITSTSYGFTLNKNIFSGYVHNIDPLTKEKGYVDNDFMTKNARFEVNIAGTFYGANAQTCHHA